MFPSAKKSLRLALFALVSVSVGTICSSRAAADTLTVTITDDSGPGSLRQAILDANGTAGVDDIVFDIPATDARYNGMWWTINLVSELPVLIDSGTRILGSSQTANQGDTNPGVVGTGGTVGVDAVPLPQYEKPEIQINAGGFNVLTIGPSASDILIEGIAIVGGENGITATGLTTVGVGGTNRVVRSMIVGLFADGNDPAALRNTGHGVVVESSAPGLGPVELTVENSYIGYNGRVGVLGVRGSSVLMVTGCEVFRSGLLSDAHDGIDVNGLPSVVTGNLSRENRNQSGVENSNSGHGIEAGSQDPGTGGHTITNNTVLNNLGSGIAVRAGASNVLVSKNIAKGNAVGVSVNGELAGQTDGNHITMNSTYENGGLAIDLHAEQSGVVYDGVTLNSPISGTTGSNGLAPFPVITEAELSGDTLIFSGYAEPGGMIEVFEAATDPTGFGEGMTYLFTVVEGSAEDRDDTEGTYGPVENQFIVSTEPLTSNRFSFSVVLGFGVGDSLLITATQTIPRVTEAGGKVQGVNTSEFSPVISAIDDPGSPIATERDEIPETFRLLGAYPNPFNPATTIAFEMERPGYVNLRVFDVLGTEVARLVDGQMPAGVHKADWDAQDLPSGTYIYRFTIDGKPLSGTVTLLK